MRRSLKGAHNGCVNSVTTESSEILRYILRGQEHPSRGCCMDSSGEAKVGGSVGAWNRFMNRSGSAICSLDRRHGDICAGREPIFACYRRRWSSDGSLWMLMGFWDERGTAAVQLSLLAVPIAAALVCVLRYMKRAFPWDFTCRNEINWFCRANAPHSPPHSGLTLILYFVLLLKHLFRQKSKATLLKLSKHPRDVENIVLFYI